ncbi:hypothetical protein DFH06DRAFT_1307998 [Mycena polygramma]|nr:hypothetical protein DFH06DRAFT_1307998 [Mycena polygramma]
MKHTLSPISTSFGSTTSPVTGARDSDSALMIECFNPLRSVETSPSSPDISPLTLDPPSDLTLPAPPSTPTSVNDGQLLDFELLSQMLAEVVEAQCAEEPLSYSLPSVCAIGNVFFPDVRRVRPFRRGLTVDVTLSQWNERSDFRGINGAVLTQIKNCGTDQVAGAVSEGRIKGVPWHVVWPITQLHTMGNSSSKSTAQKKKGPARRKAPPDNPRISIKQPGDRVAGYDEPKGSDSKRKNGGAEQSSQK